MPEDATEHSAVAFGEMFDTVVHHGEGNCVSTLNVDSTHSPQLLDEA